MEARPCRAFAFSAVTFSSWWSRSTRVRKKGYPTAFRLHSSSVSFCTCHNGGNGAADATELPSHSNTTVTQPASNTLFATHNGTDLDGYASLVGLRYLYPDATLALGRNVEEVVTKALNLFPPGMPIVSADDVVPAEWPQVVITDTQDLNRAGKWTQQLGDRVSIHVYDHHPRNEALARDPRVVFHWAPVGSACTIVTEELAEAGVAPEARDATLLLAGIYEDTGQLSFRSTSERDFAAARQLVLWGARPEEAADLLERVWNARQTEVLEELMATRRTVDWQNLRAVVARVTLPSFVPDIAMLANRLGDDGVDAAFVLVAIPQKVFFIARSFTPGVDVAAVAEKLGGGGHPAAASAVLRNQSLVEAEATLGRVLAEAGVHTVRARDLMSTPILGVDADETLGRAHAILAGHRIGSLVAWEGEKAVGSLEAAAVTAAVSHGMAGEKVQPYIRHTLEAIRPETPLTELRALLYRTGERFFLVEEYGKPLGVVTRRDILRAVYEQTVPRHDTPAIGAESTRNLAGEIRGQLGAAAEAHLRSFGQMASATGVKVFLVGGSVRDLILRRRPVDWDLVVEGDPEPFLERVREQGATVKRYGRFHTAHVTFADGLAFDLARARRETYARPGALPEVLPGSLEQDLYRRDFTMNAMAVSLMPDEFGDLIDRYRGLEDLKHGRVRVLHSLSFVDDPTRALRGIRLAVRFSFTLEDQTERLLKRAVDLRLFSESEGTRLRREFFLPFRERDPIAVFHAFDKAGVLQSVAEFGFDPELELIVKRALEWTAWYRLQFGPEVEYEETLLLGSLVLGLRYDRSTKAMQAMKLPDSERILWEALRQKAFDLERACEQSEHAGNAWHERPSAAMSTLERADDAALLLWAIRYPERRDIVSSFLSHWRDVRPAVSGADLQAMGVPQGPEMGRRLSWLRNQVLDGALPAERSAQLDALRKEFS